MEATGRDHGGAGGPSWSYRRRHEEIGSNSYNISSSSRSGTIVSSAAYTSGASRLSSGIYMEEAALELDLELELRLGTLDKRDAEFARPIKKPRKDTEEKKLKEMKMKRIESLVQEFFHRPSENHSILGGGCGGGMSALERWFSELGVSWVLQLDFEHPHIESWKKALEKIMETIRLTESFFADYGHGNVGMPGISEEEEVESGKQATTSLDPVQFALFFQEAMSKMIVFVDAMCSKSLYIGGLPTTLHSFLHIHSALSMALSGIRLQFHSSPTAEVEKIKKEMESLLSAKQGKAFDATWSALEENSNGALKSMEVCTQTRQGSSDIDTAISSVMYHINFLLANHSTVSEIASKAASLGKYVPQTGHGEAQPFISMITEMVSCIEKKLITKSQSFRDKGLGLLFLINNSNFIREELQDSLSDIKVDLEAIISSITRKVEQYTESYIQVSWEPMLACLFNPTPMRLVRKSPLSKFESKFQKIYSTQIQWKVPDPELKKRLRKAIIEKIIPGYTKYIEDSNVSNPKFSPQELEEKLQELFEG